MQLHLSGPLIFISFILTLVAYFLNWEYLIFAAIATWFAFVLLYAHIGKKLVLNILLLLSAVLFVFSLLQGFIIDFEKALLINQHLLTLLIGVGFLRLIATPKQNNIKALPQGKNSFLKTYLGIHLFGSVINLSSLVLVADKLYKKAALSKLQIIVLTRAFSSDAYWSPFFVAFAAALTYAPNLSPSFILLNGLFLALAAFIFTYMEVCKNDAFDLKAFKGYPIHFETLYIPVILALLVLVVHYYYPNSKVIILISMFSLVLTFLILPIKVGLKKSMTQFKQHITHELPLMKNELGLFLVAGAFGVAISTILIGYDVQVPFEHFNGVSASILLFVLILLSFIGIHPIISIAVIGNWMGEINHTLLAITFLMSWATAVSTSPFSGLNLTIQARYKIKAFDIFKLNITYAIKMYVVSVIILLKTAYFLNLE